MEELLFVCLILTEIQVVRKFHVKSPITKFYEDVFSCSVTVLCIQIHERTDKML